MQPLNFIHQLFFFFLRNHTAHIPRYMCQKQERLLGIKMHTGPSWTMQFISRRVHRRTKKVHIACELRKETFQTTEVPTRFKCPVHSCYLDQAETHLGLPPRHFTQKHKTLTSSNQMQNLASATRYPQAASQGGTVRKGHAIAAAMWTF